MMNVSSMLQEYANDVESKYLGRVHTGRVYNMRAKFRESTAWSYIRAFVIKF